MFVEHRMLHLHRGHVPEARYEVGPIGKARVLAEGDDVTLVGISHAASSACGPPTRWPRSASRPR